MKFSVIIATYNAQKTLEEALLSVLNQTHKDTEILVIDGGSTDGTLSILHRYAPRLAYWVSQPDRGVYDAWNTALPHVTGDWVYFLGADDTLFPQAFEHFAQHVSAYQNEESSLQPQDHRIVYGKVHVVEPLVRRKEVNRPWEQLQDNFFRFGNIHHQGVFHHRSLFQLYGPFDLSFRFAADYEMMLRSICQIPPLFFDILVANAYVGGMSSQRKNAWHIVLEYRRALQKHARYKPTFLWYLYFAYALIRRFV